MRFPVGATQVAQHLPLLAAPSVVSLVSLPILYEGYQAAQPPEKLAALLAVLLAKRATLYACATSTLFVAAMRSGDAQAGLGQRVTAITAEAVRPATLPELQTAELQEVATALDSTPASVQAAGLPLIFGALLIVSFAVTGLLSPAAPPTAEPPPLPAEVLDALRGALSTFQSLSTASVCLFAVNAEAQASARALAGEGVSTVAGGPAELGSPTPLSLAAAAASFSLVGSAYLLGPAEAWPAQNFVNSCIGIGVARVLQLPSLAAVLAALGGLAVYDGLGTLGTLTAAVAAEPVSTSLMEGVARAKVAAASGGGELAWQPGLLAVVLGGRVTDGLGLGDVVAPSLLVGWARRFDLRITADAEAGAGEVDAAEAADGNRSEGGYLTTALVGYLMGCVLLEVAPPALSRAALLFLVPSTASAVLLRLAMRGDLRAAFASQPLSKPPPPPAE